MSKRVVIWGTGFVGRMVIPEVLRHPEFGLVGVGVSNPAKVGVDVGEICGLPEATGIRATDDVVRRQTAQSARARIAASRLDSWSRPPAE